MDVVFTLLSFVVQIYLFVLIARLVIDWIQMFARDWRPRGALLFVCEAIYTVTDPPLRALRRVIPPLRLGGVALDLAFLVLMLGLSLLISLLTWMAQVVRV